MDRELRPVIRGVIPDLAEQKAFKARKVHISFAFSGLGSLKANPTYPWGLDKSDEFVRISHPVYKIRTY